MIRGKRLTALGTAICLLALTGCESKIKPSPSTGGENRETVSVTPTPTQEPDPAEEIVRDLKDLHVIIADWWTEEGWNTAESAYDEAYLDEQKSAMQKYHYTLERLKAGDYRDSWPEEIITSALDDRAKASIVAVEPKWIPKLVEAGAILDISRAETVNWNEDKYNQGVLNAMSLNGNTYGFTDEIHPCGGVFINKTLLELAGMDPSELDNLQQSGQWDFAKFEELCERFTVDTDGDGITDVYGVSGPADEFLRSLIIANDSDLVVLENGGLKLNTDDGKLLKALEFGSDIMLSGYYAKPDDADGFSVFADGKALMLFTTDDALETINRLKKEYGLDVYYMAAPKGPDADGYITLCRENVYVVLDCAAIRNRLDDILFAYDIYAQPATTMNGVDLTQKLKKQNEALLSEVSDARSYRTVMSMLETYKKYMPASEVWVPGLKTEALGKIADGKTPKEVLEAASAGWQALVDAGNAKLR